MGAVTVGAVLFAILLMVAAAMVCAALRAAGCMLRERSSGVSVDGGATDPQSINH